MLGKLSTCAGFHAGAGFLVVNKVERQELSRKLPWLCFIIVEPLLRCLQCPA